MQISTSPWIQELLQPRYVLPPLVQILQEQWELNHAFSNDCVLRSIASPTPWVQHVVC